MSDEHKRDQKIETTFAVLVVSDTRTEATDKSGKIAKELATAEGHKIGAYDIVPNDAGAIREMVLRYIDDPEIRVILTSGGTGVGKKDKTADVLGQLFEKTLDGFGEHFRRVSHNEIGLPGIYSRASAGLIGKKVAFCLPGSKNAMATALREIILPSIGHLLWEVDR
ncbi:MAG: MogA/MoaB family molybdenum cofactor biosynthesis protein [Candidatus Thorarchaeota archaeon]|jgi:molybdenum cofactor biosynthesis protein B